MLRVNPGIIRSIVLGVTTNDEIILLRGTQIGSTAQGRVDIEKTLLCDVFGVVEVAQFALRQAIDRILILLNQTGKGVLVTRKDFLYEILIG